MLEDSVLVRCQTIWDWHFSPREGHLLAVDRPILNILTIVARCLGHLMGWKGTSDVGARLFHLFLYTEAKDPDGKLVSWDLAVYLRAVQARLIEQDPTTLISLRKLNSALSILGPFCEMRDDLRAAWQRLNLPRASDDRSFSNFELADFFRLHETPEVLDAASPTRPDCEKAAHLTESDLSLLYLDASMR
ncbi:hypothetical protein AURDEDRAFT_165906 [Auricularia subglabra TFB-10046 SS5]|nr:hypothetical protein AURDEDRAFT_165906 [Auricularia subglabra TFB-10046 SS5]